MTPEQKQRTVSDDTQVEQEVPQVDWQQVALNGGPPCFAQLDDEAGWYCGRAQRWEGHDGEHEFVSLADLLATVRREAFKEACDLIPNSWLDPLLSGADKVIGTYPYGCPDFERVLNAIRERIHNADCGIVSAAP